MMAVVGALFVILAALAQMPARADDLTTVAERSTYARTGRYDEVVRLCAAFARTWPAQVRCAEFGRTPEGRPMLALVASSDGTLTAAAARAKARPVVLIQGGIHAGEIDGKDAGFLALREILEGQGRARRPRPRHAGVRAGLQRRRARARLAARTGPTRSGPKKSAGASPART